MKQKYLQTLKKLFKQLEQEPSLQRSCQDLIDHINQWPEQDIIANNSNGETQYRLPELIQLNNQVALFSDGACRGNPGPGSWACFGQNAAGEMIFETSSFEEDTTNNRMELKGVINAIKSGLEYCLAEQILNPHFFVFTDSKYVSQGMNQWMAGWKKRQWRKADGKPPENLELWQELDIVSSKVFKVEAHWVKGHSGHPQNEHCDKLCNTILDQEGF